jgi:hypothetical protein
MSIQSNIAKVRRYVPLAHYATAVVMLVAAFLGSEELRFWFAVAALISILAGIGFYAFMRHLEQKLNTPKR